MIEILHHFSKYVRYVEKDCIDSTQEDVSLKLLQSFLEVTSLLHVLLSKMWPMEIVALLDLNV